MTKYLIILNLNKDTNLLMRLIIQEFLNYICLEEIVTLLIDKFQSEISSIHCKPNSWVLWKFITFQVVMIVLLLLLISHFQYRFWKLLPRFKINIRKKIPFSFGIFLIWVLLVELGHNIHFSIMILEMINY
jgi:hypothetical protein